MNQGLDPDGARESRWPVASGPETQEAWGCNHALGCGIISMRALRSAWFWNGLITASLCVAIGCGPVGLAAMAIGQEPAPGPTLLELRHGLEGMQFIGTLAVGDETNPSEDVLTFKDGEFSSQTCLETGFAPAPYWVRSDADGLHFRAELQNPEHGTIRFEGLFDGEEMQASALWTKRRWYWTIEQKFRFTGRPVGRPE
jgi:hypothetical protein